METPNTGTKTIIWALDPFDEAEQLRSKTASLARYWSLNTGSAVQPVYVLSTRQFVRAFGIEFDPIAHLEDEAIRKIDQIIKDVKFESVLNPKIITVNSWSKIKDADALSDFAVQSGASHIFIGTHGRRGMQRLLMGSFAESLLMRSQVPVVTTGVSTQIGYRVDHILFPTEFGRYSRWVIRRVVALAKELEARITLFHALRDPLETFLLSGASIYGGYRNTIPLDEYRDLQIKRYKRRLEAWQRWCENQGVATDYELDSSGNMPPDAILYTAVKQRASLITLEAESGWVTAALLGSTTRQVIRDSHCPIWVVRPARAMAVPAPEGRLARPTAKAA